MSDIQQFLQDVSSGYWWLSVVVVSLIMGVLGNALYKGTETFLARYSKRLKKKVEERRERNKREDDELISELFANPDRFNWYLQNTTAGRILGMGLLMLCYIVPTVSSDSSRTILDLFVLSALLVLGIASFFWLRKREYIIDRILELKDPLTEDETE